jgi:hypothetical protein
MRAAGDRSNNAATGLLPATQADTTEEHKGEDSNEIDPFGQPYVPTSPLPLKRHYSEFMGE